MAKIKCEIMFEGISSDGSHKQSVINDGKRKERVTLFILRELIRQS
jgi:hypothetical protein